MDDQRQELRPRTPAAAAPSKSSGCCESWLRPSVAPTALQQPASAAPPSNGCCHSLQLPAPTPSPQTRPGGTSGTGMYCYLAASPIAATPSTAGPIAAPPVDPIPVASPGASTTCRDTRRQVVTLRYRQLSPLRPESGRMPRRPRNGTYWHVLCELQLNYMFQPRSNHTRRIEKPQWSGSATNTLPRVCQRVAHVRVPHNCVH